VPYSDSEDRVEHIAAALTAAGFAELHDAAPADPQALTGIHDPAYLAFLSGAYADWLREGAEYGLAVDGALLPALSAPRRPLPPGTPPPRSLFARAGYHLLDLAAPIVAGTYGAALASAGCAIAAADAVLRSSSHSPRAAFALCRPPGHHAGRDFAGGFCYLNNAALAAHRLQAALAGPVALLDIDYHAGNGSQDIFYDRPDVLSVSLHADPAWEYPFFSGHADQTGIGAGRGCHRNLPLPPHTDDAGYLDALATALAWLRPQQPRALVVSVGFDIYIDDPLGRFDITRAGLAAIGARLADLGLPTVLALEGGYQTADLGQNAVAFLQPFSTRPI
jgi:acetoin utilization deacetylase AcuC-like enzyme